MNSIARRTLRAIRSAFPISDHVEVDGSVIPSPDLRWCGPEFRDDAYFLDSAEGEARRLTMHFGCTAASRILDVGCGQGRLAIGILRVLGALDYLGIDIHKPSIDWCRRNIERRHPPFRFRHLDVYNERYNTTGERLSPQFRFDIAPASVDVIYLYSVFSHTTEADMRIYLDEFARVLDPRGGIFFTTFVEEGVPDVSINPEGYKLRCSGPLHIVRYDKDYLFGLLPRHGFTVRHYSHGSEANGQSALYLSKA
jgi:SAM-dependent methyltransferase